MSAGRRGFTLMEILIAIAVITVGLVGVVAVFPVALRDVQKSQDISIAAELAQSVKAALKAGFANAHFDRATESYYVTLVHPGQRPTDLSAASHPLGGTTHPEVLDFLKLPPAGTEENDPYIFPSYPQRDPLKFYTLTYSDSGDKVQALRYYSQSTQDTDGSENENAFQSMRDPYIQYGFNIVIYPMEDRPNLFMVGIRIARNPDLYTLIGGSSLDDTQKIIKDEYWTILSVK